MRAGAVIGCLKLIMSSKSTPQSLSLRILCSPTSTDDSPTLESYTNGLLSLQWSTPAGCARGIEGDDDNDDNDDVPDTPGEKRKGRGFWGFIGLFFWLGVAGLIAYFAIGECVCVCECTSSIRTS
jgi:hypothetical protein